MNKVIISGNLVANPQSYKNAEGKEWASFKIACPKMTVKNECDFIPCTAFGAIGQNIINYCKKGSKVICEGYINSGSYMGKDGKQVNKIDVIVSRIEFIATDRRTKDTENETVAETTPTFKEVTEDTLPF